jgi:uncharacterized damage-inducible protein DinB
VKSSEIAFPKGSPDDAELLVQFLDYLRGAVLRNTEGISDDEGHWTPDGRLTSLVGILNHLTNMEWRWMDGGFEGADVDQADDEFRPGPNLTLEQAARDYQARGAKTNSMIRSIPLTEVGTGWAKGHDLRFVALHILDETARHAGHADAVREFIDGATGL